MNFLHNEGILYILLIVSVIDFTVPWPILSPKVKTSEQELEADFISKLRLTRQIVQPTWLNNDREPTIDATVHVNPQSIFETAEIRKTIQKAIEEDSFAVSDEQQDTNSKMEESFSIRTTEKTNATHVVNRLPKWYFQIRKFWHNWTQGLFKGVRN